MSNTSPFDVTLAPACTPCEKDRTTFCCDGTPCTDQSLPCASCVSYAVRGGGGGGKFQICMLAVDMLASTACCSQLMRWMQVVGVEQQL